MGISNANVWNAGMNSSTGNYEVDIKTCLNCGHTQRLPSKNIICPTCDHPTLYYFLSIHHLVGYIDKYGLKKIRIVDEDILETVLQAFQ